MADPIDDSDRIGPQLDLANLDVPPHVGEHLATLYDAPERIESGADWVAATRRASERATGSRPTESDLCHLDDGAHSVAINSEEHRFVCVLDPLAVPFLRDEPGTVTSTTPVDEATVTIDIDADGVSVDPDEAVISVGVSRSPDVSEVPTHEDIYAEACPYIHAFASVAEYEQWADETDGATTSLPAETGVAVARELAAGLFAEA